MEYVLVKWEDNWADEMDVSGFRIYEKPIWDNMQSKLTAYKDEFTICIGTNEEIDYSNGKDLLKCMTSVLLTESEYKAILRVLGEEFGETSPFNNCPIRDND